MFIQCTYTRSRHCTYPDPHADNITDLMYKCELNPRRKITLAQCKTRSDAASLFVDQGLHFV